MESTFDAFIAMDNRGMITDWSTQAEAMFGWTRDEAIGKSVASIVRWEQIGQGGQHSLRDLLGMETSRFRERIEVTACHRDGYEFPVEAAISSLQLGRE